MKKTNFTKVFSFLGIVTFSLAAFFLIIPKIFLADDNQTQYSSTEEAWISTATTYDDVATLENFKAALLKEEDKVIVLTSDFEISETLTICGNTKITSSDEVTLTRGSSFVDDMFVLQSGAYVVVDACGGGAFSQRK